MALCKRLTPEMKRMPTKIKPQKYFFKCFRDFCRKMEIHQTQVLEGFPLHYEAFPKFFYGFPLFSWQLILRDFPIFSRDIKNCTCTESTYYGNLIMHVFVSLLTLCSLFRPTVPLLSSSDMECVRSKQRNQN